MDQELKQRLIGAAIITALAAIFVPMLFDDAVEESGKEVNSLSIPPLPVKEQEVEIAPLPEKSEDVATTAPAAPTEKSLKTAPSPLMEGEGEEDVTPRKPITHLSGNSRTVTTAPKHAHMPAPDVGVGDADQPPLPEAEDLAPVVKPSKSPVAATQPAVSSANNPPPRSVKPAAKPADNAPEDNIAKTTPSASNDTGTRWYLNAGSFTQKANAIALQETLKQQGFATTLKEVANDKGTVFKVRIGPMLDRAKAQAVKNKLSQINVNSFVSPDE